MGLEQKGSGVQNSGSSVFFFWKQGFVHCSESWLRKLNQKQKLWGIESNLAALHLTTSYYNLSPYHSQAHLGANRNPQELQVAPEAPWGVSLTIQQATLS